MSYLTNPYRYESPVVNWYEQTEQAAANVLTIHVAYCFILGHKNESGAARTTSQLTVYMSAPAAISPASTTIHSAIWDDTSPNPVKQFDGADMNTDEITTGLSYGSYLPHTFTFSPARVVEENWTVGIWTETVYDDEKFPKIAGEQPIGALDYTQCRRKAANWSEENWISLTCTIGG